MATKKVKKENEVAAPTTAPTQTAPTGQQPAGTQSATDLNIADLKNIALVIDVASTRGAFRANEMATVGLINNKRQGFLGKVAPENKVEEPTKKADTTTG